MFILSKFISLFLSPLIWILVIIVLILITKKGRKRNWLIFVWVLMLYFFSTFSVINKIVERYEMPYQPLTKGKIYDCAVVLSGGSNFDEFSSSLQLNQAAERLTEPVILFRKGIVKKLLITGGSANIFPPYQKEATYVRLFWMDLGVPDSSIIVESESRNTSENALFTKKLLENMGLSKNILLITSAIHAPRSQYIFKNEGMQFDIYPVDFMVNRKAIKKFKLEDHLVPKTGAIGEWEALIHEWVGLLAARF